MPTQLITFPAPIGGWNTISPIDGMPPQDAVVMDNIFPDTTSCVLRHGSEEFRATGEVDPVRTLMTYTGGGANTLIAAVAGKLYNATANPPTVLSTGYGSDIWTYENFTTAGTAVLIAANNSGLDTPIIYDGSTVSPIVVTGPTPTDLSQVLVYQSRIFYVQRNSLSVWYSDAGAYQGALTEFDFGQFANKGGSIAAISTWTRDNGYGGVDDLFVIVTTKGQVLLYNGIDPSLLTTWVMVGRFDVGEPVSGPHCLVRTGPDLVLLCADGFQPLSEYLTTGTTRAQTTNLGYKISQAASEAVRFFSPLSGWQGIIYPRRTALYINVPIGASAFQQYVVNTTTGAWCRFTGMNAYCWRLYNGNLYYGGADGKIYLSDVGFQDSGSEIVGNIKWSYQSPGRLVRQARFIMARPLIRVTGDVLYNVQISVDFISTNVPNLTGFVHADTTIVSRNWQSVSGIGYSVAPDFYIRRAGEDSTIEIINCEITFEFGGVI